MNSGSSSVNGELKFKAPSGLFKQALSASGQGLGEKSGMDIDGSSSNDVAKRSLRDRMGQQNGRRISLNTPATIPSGPSGKRTDMAGVELLPSGPPAKRRGPVMDSPAGARRAQRNGKPYDAKGKVGSSANAKGALARMSGKQSQNPLPSRPIPVKSKMRKGPSRDWRTTKNKFFTEETKQWLEKRYLGDNMMDLSNLLEDEYLKKEGLPGLQAKSGTYYFKILNKFAQREGATPITKINLSSNGLESLVSIKDFRWTLRQIHAIDLRDNPIRNVKALDDIMTKFELSGETKNPTHPVDIEEIRFDGCAFREEMTKTDEKKYFEEIMRRFPKLKHLDGHEVTQLRQILYPPEQPIPTPILQTAPPVTPTPPTNPAADTPEYKEALIAAFSGQSGMNRDWTVLCLEGNGWDGERAWADYVSKKETIPAEAYVKA